VSKRREPSQDRRRSRLRPGRLRRNRGPLPLRLPAALPRRAHPRAQRRALRRFRPILGR
jgi:hypothetical protein